MPKEAEGDALDHLPPAAGATQRNPHGAAARLDPFAAAVRILAGAAWAAMPSNRHSAFLVVVPTEYPAQQAQMQGFLHHVSYYGRSQKIWPEVALGPPICLGTTHVTRSVRVHVSVPVLPQKSAVIHHQPEATAPLYPAALPLHLWNAKGPFHLWNANKGAHVTAVQEQARGLPPPLSGPLQTAWNNPIIGLRRRTSHKSLRVLGIWLKSKCRDIAVAAAELFDHPALRGPCRKQWDGLECQDAPWNLMTTTHTLCLLVPRTPPTLLSPQAASRQRYILMNGRMEQMSPIRLHHRLQQQRVGRFSC